MVSIFSAYSVNNFDRRPALLVKHRIWKSWKLSSGLQILLHVTYTQAWVDQDVDRALKQFGYAQCRALEHVIKEFDGTKHKVGSNTANF